MRLVTFRSEEGPRAGLLRDDTVAEVGGSVRELLADDRIDELDADAPATAGLDEVELLPPVPDPSKIVCIGLNYRAHAAEAESTRPRARRCSPSTPTPWRRPVRRCRCRRRARRSTSRPRSRS